MEEEVIIYEELQEYDEDCIGRCSLWERAAMYFMALSIISVIVFFAYLIKQVS